ncbi:translation initiation factor IF-2-like [Onychomys torridus]|uniref:translation initiation factor IF-2-like n=1 Tax=Onychomys torridus TaxID=38674 RepID=UPI00167FAEC9|nr:translation initiation factor IF-2-like [Onychomys torridus]
MRQVTSTPSGEPVHRPASLHTPHHHHIFIPGELQLPRASSAPPPDVALPRPLMPRPPASSSPPSQCVSVTQRRFEAEGPSGAPPPPPLQRQHQQREQQQRQRQEQRLQRPCGAIGSACSPGELTTKRARAPLPSALLGAWLRVPLGLAGLGGWREGGGLRGCLRSTGARAAPAPAPGVRAPALAAGRAGVPATSGRPVSAAPGTGRGGPAARNFLRASAGGGAAVRAPAGRRRGAEFAAPHPALWEEAPL